MTSNPLLPVADALARVLAGVAPLDTECVSLRDAAGRTLASPLTATLTHPPFDASAMDGYAVRAADTAIVPAMLRLIGVAAAGRPYAGNLNAGDAIRIFTGAPVPAGADAVVIQEDTTREGMGREDMGREDMGRDGAHVTILEPAKTGDNIRLAGQDFRAGDALLAPGRHLKPRDILLAAASGHATLAVHKKPIVAILATGDELVEPGTAPATGQIIASNSYGLAALIDASGGVPHLLGIARDTHDGLAEKFAAAAAADADILVTTGGASAGDHDLVRPALEAAGATLAFYKIAMRPGKPMFFGTRPRPDGATPQRILGLPGNPLSALIGARVFLIPLIAKMLGQPETLHTVTATLSQPLEANGPRDHYMRASLDHASSPPRVTPLANQDSAMVSALAAADCLIIVPANAPAQNEGARVTVMLLDF